PLMQGFGLLILPLFSIEEGQIVQAFGRIGMLRSQLLLSDRESLLVERLRLLVFSLACIQICEIVEGEYDIGMLLPQRLLPNQQGALIKLRCFYVLAFTLRA